MYHVSTIHQWMMGEPCEAGAEAEAEAVTALQPGARAAGVEGVVCAYWHYVIMLLAGYIH